MRKRGLRSYADLCRALQGVVTLLQHPEQLDELKNDPSLAKGTVEELPRSHTPLPPAHPRGAPPRRPHPSR